MSIKKAKIIVDYKVKKLCKKPYYNHPKGCPNYNKRSSCPPQSNKIEDMIDLSKPTYVIFTTFDLKKHVHRMRRKHSRWTYRQLACCLYWQGITRKNLHQEILRFLDKTKKSKREYKVIKVPESFGVNVTSTMLGIGHELEWPPKNKTYQVAVAGVI